MILIENTFLNRFDSIIKVRITGRNINNFIKKLIKYKIKIIKLKYISYKEIIVVINYDDYLKLLKHKSIYEIEAVDDMGRLKIEDNLKKNRILFIMIILGLGLLLLLSNVIFDIEVIHSSSEIRTLIIDELEKYGVSKYKIKKNYEELEKIKEKILEDNEDKLEWIEIIESGVKYIVRVQERVINPPETDIPYQDIVSNKTAIITKIIATKGEKVKEINSYVNKGDTIITGSLVRPDGTVTYTQALGCVYGEVWYSVTIEYSYIYREEKLTGNKDTVYVINFLGKKWELFSNKYQNYKSVSTNILSNYLLPISLVKEEREELEVTEAIYTYDEAINKALDLAREKLLNSSDKIKEVKNIKILDQYDTNENTIKLKLFVSVIEDITNYRKIDINEEENNDNTSD